MSDVSGVNNNSILYGYGTALAGGAAGALYGAKTAPSVLGKLDVDKILAHDIQTDIAHDNILKHLGPAQRDFFVKSRNKWFDIEHCIKKNADFMFARVGSSSKSEVTVSQLKHALSDKNIISSITAYGVEQIENYKKALEGIADDTKLTRESLGNLLRKNHSIYNDVKADIKTILDNAPKLKGKYGAMYGVISAAVAGFIGMLIANSTLNN